MTTEQPCLQVLCCKTNFQSLELLTNSCHSLQEEEAYTLPIPVGITEEDTILQESYVHPFV